MTETTCYQRNRETILNRSKICYNKNEGKKNQKERLKEREKCKYKELPEEEKNKKREYGRNKCLNISQEKKQKFKEYWKNYRESKRSQSSDQ